MAVVLGKQSALRVWDSVVAGGNRCARVDWNAPVNRGMSPDQRIHVTPNMPATSQGVTAANQSVSFAFRDGGIIVARWSAIQKLPSNSSNRLSRLSSRQP